MKKFLKWFMLPLFGFILVSILTLAGIIFFRPSLIINSKNTAWALNKAQVFTAWSWKDFEFNHEWKAWNNRILKGHLTDFCFKLDRPGLNINTCLEEVSWNLEIHWDNGFKSKTLAPFRVRSSLMEVSMKEAEEQTSGPPDIYGYWTKLWSDLVPDIDVHFKKIVFKENVFDFKLIKKPDSLEAQALGFTLKADPKRFTVLAPSPYEFPKKLPTDGPLYFRDVKLQGLVKKSGIKMDLDGSIAPFDFDFNSHLRLPLRDELTSVSVKKDLLLNTKGVISVKGVKASMQKHAPDPYKTLPAPLNEMDGDIISKISTSNDGKDSVIIKAVTSITLQSTAQALIMDVGTDAPVNLRTNSIASIFLDLSFKRVALLLPRLSKKKLPPQFIPDSRIKKTLTGKKTADKKGPDLEVLLMALNDKALHIKSGLLDEPLRLNFKLLISENSIEKGFISVLPLKTRVFKRPIRVQNLDVTFNRPLEPVIEATIFFPLPEYKVTLTLEGPISKPRYNFRSEPPLPQSDIYAVLLFGRPMADLDSNDKGAAAKTNQILSQGILSLSVLYFLAGSPVEYVGYDPGSNSAVAQFGLGKKTSLKVGGGQEGLNSTGVRRSLGKGWYLDTSVQNPGPKTSNDTSRNYGVLIERIIAY